jgi:hypothetical protein
MNQLRENIERTGSGFNSLGLFSTNGFSLSAGEEGLNLNSVGGVSNESGEFSQHLLLVKLHYNIELFPELLFIRHSSVSIEFNLT